MASMVNAPSKSRVPQLRRATSADLAQRRVSAISIQDQDGSASDAGQAFAASIASDQFAWHYFEGLASGFVTHLERMKSSGPVLGRLGGGLVPRHLQMPLLIGLLAVGFGGSYVCPALFVEMEIIVTGLQALALWCLVSFCIIPRAVDVAEYLDVAGAYSPVIDGLTPLANYFLFGVLLFLVALQRQSEPVLTAGINKIALAFIGGSMLAAGRWFVEGLYSTRMLKLRCGQRVLQNAWERALVDRFWDVGSRDRPLPKDTKQEFPCVLPLCNCPWEFDLQCAELIRLHAKDAEARQNTKGYTDEGDAKALFNKLVAFTKGLGETEGETYVCRTLQEEDLKKVLCQADLERAWSWFWGDGGAGAGSWLWHECGGGGLSIDEVMFVNKILAAKTETQDLVSNICEYNTIFALFRDVVRVAFYSAMLVLLLSLFVPGAVATLWWTVSSALVAVSFIFGPLIKDGCESLLLILFIRPFDIGEKVVIDGGRYLVVDISVLTTTFLNSYNELVWFRNSQIFSKSAGIANLTRSKNAVCGVEIDLLAKDCTQANIEMLSASVRRHCEAFPEAWVASECGDATAISGKYRGTVSSMAECGPGQLRWKFRAVHQSTLHKSNQVHKDTSKLMLALVEACEAKGIQLRQPPLDVFQQTRYVKDEE